MAESSHPSVSTPFFTDHFTGYEMHTVETDLEFAANVAIEVRKYLLDKWRGEYARNYPVDIVADRISDIQDDIQRLQTIKKDAKNARV